MGLVGRLRRRDQDRGAAVIEFALVLPLLIMLVFGIVQYGLHFHRQQGYHAAAREGARVASIPNTTKPEIILHTESALTGILGDDPTITVTPDIDVPCDRRRGELVQVDVTVPATIEIPLVGTKNYTLTGHGEFRCE